jgi:hypothetical protein
VENLRHEPTVGKRLMEGKSPGSPSVSGLARNAPISGLPSSVPTDADMSVIAPSEKTLMISLYFFRP